MTPEEIQARVREVFRIEARELVVELETALLELEQDPADASLINRVFRALHTLKGSGATSGYPALSQFLHHVEDVFFAAREGRLAVDAALIDCALVIKDVIPAYLAAAPADAPGILAGAAGALEALRRYLPSDAAGASATPAPTATAERRYAIEFTPSPELFRSGTDPGMFLDDLRALGPCLVTAIGERVPPLETLDPEACHLSWRIELSTTAGLDAIREIFAFIIDECTLGIHESEPAESPAPPSQGASSGAEVGARSWSIAFETTPSVNDAPGAIDGLWRDLGALGRLQVVEKPAQGEIGRWRAELHGTAIVTDERIRDAFIFLAGVTPQLGPLDRDTVDGRAPAAQTRSPPAAPARAPGEVLRVSAQKLDRLVDMVGELVILRSLVGNACATMSDVPPGLASASEGLDRLTKELRDVVLGIRMMPVGDTFATFRRLCRDLSRELGKEVDLVIEGAETEIDKTMLEQIKDPLVHLVRNSLDHGFELPDERERAGKARRGTLRLVARQEGDRVCITVADDGRGLDASRIRAKAVERGLVTADARLSEKEIHQLIFMAGFSTAERVSEVSGRGVGMDVVKRAIEGLRGSIDIESNPGRGTAVKLSVPLTLAIIEGLMVGVDGDRYILPLSSVLETVAFDPRSRERNNGRNLVELRRDLVPYVDLRDVFSPRTPRPGEQRAVVVDCEGARVGLIVDVVFGNHQTVIKPLGWAARQAGVFSGSTILGDGKVALICDIPALVARAGRSRSGDRGLES